MSYVYQLKNMSLNKEKHPRKNREEKEEYMYYDVVRTSEGRRSIIPKLAVGEEQVSFDCVEAESFIRRCLDPMIAEARENIQFQMNDKAFLSDFMACNVRMFQVFVRPFSFGLYVQKCNNHGIAYLALKAIEPGTFPLFEGSIFITKGTRDHLLKYIERDSFREELFLMMKDLMHSHHKELLRLQSGK